MKMKTLYAIQISKLINPTLIEWGWKVGDFVCLYHNDRGLISFEVPADRDALFVCFSSDRAKRELRNRGKHFVGVEFKIVSFAQSKVKSNEEDQVPSFVKCTCGEEEMAAECGPDDIQHSAECAISKIPPHTTHHDHCPCWVKT